MPRMHAPGERPEGSFYLPHYFPDEDQFTATTSLVAKSGYVTARFTFRHDTLKGVADTGKPVEGVPELPSANVLVNADAYPAYFNWLRDHGTRFADATPGQREEVTVLAPMAAVIAPGVADPERFLFTDGWSEVSFPFARQVIQDFLDPEALLLQ